ncbi:hypothetical protein [Mucilaginibacter sp.]|uniref:hypothetical protein n=1 Tax=Mucilaginibacter sp. TaxID=1882438 RepID=UPI00326723B6
MKHIYFLIAVITLATSCKKDGSYNVKTTLSATAYITDYKGETRRALVDMYLIKPEDRGDLKNVNTVSENCPNHSIIAFTSRATSYYKNDVPTGDYILVMQVSPLEEDWNWFRYSYKEISISKGDELNEVMVFSYGGKATSPEPWNSNK